MPPRKTAKTDLDSNAELIERLPPARSATPRILDLFEGDKSGLDNLLTLDKMSVTRPKGVLAVTLQLTQEIGDAMGWPACFVANRNALLAAMASEKTTEKSEKTRNVDVRLTLGRVAGDTQTGILGPRVVRLWKVKATAKPDDGEIRWYVQLAGEWVAEVIEDLVNALGGQVQVETAPVQQTIPAAKRPISPASELPPEPGDDMVQ